MQVAGWFDWARIIRVLTVHYQLQLLCLLKTSVCYQSIFMADFPCPECNICFAAPHQCNGHRRLVHQSCRNPTLAKCGGEAQHSQSWGFGVLRDSRMFRVR
jgi:hypothetical protein